MKNNIFLYSFVLAFSFLSATPQIYGTILATQNLPIVGQVLLTLSTFFSSTTLRINAIKDQLGKFLSRKMHLELASLTPEMLKEISKAKRLKEIISEMPNEFIVRLINMGREDSVI